MGRDGNASVDLIWFLWVMLVRKCVVIILHFSSFRPIVTQHLFFRVSPVFLNETLQRDKTRQVFLIIYQGLCHYVWHVDKTDHILFQDFVLHCSFAIIIIVLSLATLNRTTWTPAVIWVWFRVFSVLRVASRMGEDRRPGVRGLLCRVS